MVMTLLDQILSPHLRSRTAGGSWMILRESNQLKQRGKRKGLENIGEHI